MIKCGLIYDPQLNPFWSDYYEVFIHLTGAVPYFYELDSNDDNDDSYDDVTYH